MSTWETAPDNDREDLVTASGSPAPRLSPRWRTAAVALATVAALIIVVVKLSSSGYAASGSVETEGFLEETEAAAATCDPTADCQQCADEATCFQCHKSRDCAHCDQGGNCNECYAAAQLTCCEQSMGGIRNRAECCQRPELKDKTPLCTKTCGGDYQACGAWQCCATAGFKCYTKHAWYAQCRPGCAPDKVEPGVATWDCDILPASGEGAAEPLQCAAEGENCRESRCCQNQDMSCYEKNQWWSSCRLKETCIAGPWEAEEGQPWAADWSCKLDEDPKAGCQTEKVKQFDRRRAYYKPVEACEKLGAGWKPVEDEKKCKEQSTTDSSNPMEQVQDKRYAVAGCSFDYGAHKYVWNSEPASYTKCSNSKACVCQKCEPLAPVP